MGDAPISARLRAFAPHEKAPEGAIQSTNCAVDAGRQSRVASLTEAVANVVAGYLAALLAQQIVMPAFGVNVGLATHAAIALVFTLLSLVRSYVLRRLFEHIAWRRRGRQRLPGDRSEQCLAGGSR